MKSNFQTTIKVHPMMTGYDKIKNWITSPGVVVIDSYEDSAHAARLRACRLFSRLGALGCIMDHDTKAV